MTLSTRFRLWNLARRRLALCRFCSDPAPIKVLHGGACPDCSTANLEWLAELGATVCWPMKTKGTIP